jgi:hypothetical protein
MKKKLLSLLVVCSGMVTGANAQTTLMFEDFTDGGAGSLNSWTQENNGTTTMTWTTGDTDEISPSSPNGFAFIYGGEVSGTNLVEKAGAVNSLISPWYNTGVENTVFLEFDQFHYAIFNEGEREVYVRTDGTAWNKVYREIADVRPYKNTVLNITQYVAGKDSVQIKFTYKTEYEYYWILDAVKLYVPADNNVKVLNTSINDYINVNNVNTASVSVENLGAIELTSLVISSQIGSEIAIIDTITGLSIASGASGQFNLNNAISPLGGAGLYNFNVDVLEVNFGADADTDNNQAAAITVAYDGQNVVTRKPLLEVFTSSTCPPCHPGNQKLHAYIDGRDDDEYVLLKYQGVGPGTGDPYATFEGYNRGGFYGIPGWPTLEIDGGYNTNPNSFVGNDYINKLNVPAVMTIEGEHSINVGTKTVNYSVDVTPVFDITDGEASLFIAILEKRTTANKKSNNETEFFHVMKKMINGEVGQAINGLTAGQTVTVSGSHTFPGSYRLPTAAVNTNNQYIGINNTTEHSVEEFEDLIVVTWVEWKNNKKVLQAENSSDISSSIIALEKASILDLNVYPNPANDFVNAVFTLENNANVTLSLVNSVTGKVVRSKDLQLIAGKAEVQFNTADVANGVYMLNITAEGNVIATTNAVIAH